MNKYNQVEEKLAGSLTAKTTELLPHLPYLLQDIWELGSDSRVMVDLIKENCSVSKETRILDLGCGKGAVTILLCKELGVQVKGIDLILEFLEDALDKANEYGVKHLCEFTLQDINESVKVESGYDIVILGAVGDVLGDPAQTLRKLKSVIHKEGYILIDEAYLTGNQEEVKYQNYEYLTLAQWKKHFMDLNLEIVTQCDNSSDSYEDENDYNNQMIQQRAYELIEKYPEKSEIFQGYVESQEAECEDLQDSVVGVTWLLKSK